MPARRGRNLRSYRRKAARLKRDGGVCWLCGKAIDPSLDPRHPMSGTADHVAPLAAGGHIHGELRPAHRSCNSRRGDGTKRRAATTRTSRRW